MTDSLGDSREIGPLAVRGTGMKWWLEATIAVAVVIVSGFLCTALWAWARAGESISEAADSITDAGKQLPAIEDAITRPCGGTEPCGTLATINKTVVKAGDAIVLTQLQEQRIAPATVAAVDSLNVSAVKLGSAADSLSGSAQDAGKLAQALTADANSANETILAAKPVLASFAADGDGLNELLKSKAINETLANTDVFRGGMATTSVNMGKISTHLEKTVDSQKPLWQTLIPGAELGGKLWACMFYHVCVD
jgi:hypothetical protein